jgi:hypothetical protein
LGIRAFDPNHFALYVPHYHLQPNLGLLLIIEVENDLQVIPRLDLIGGITGKPHAAHGKIHHLQGAPPVAVEVEISPVEVNGLSIVLPKFYGGPKRLTAFAGHLDPFTGVLQWSGIDGL